jgi:hypothetical protein
VNTQPSHLRFAGTVLLLLVPSFVLWMALGPWIAGPVVALCNLVLPAWMPELVAAVQLSESGALVLTHYGELDGKLVAAHRAGYQLGFPVDVRQLSYSIPFYAALHFSTRQESSFEKFSWGLLALYLLVFIGVICVSLKNLMVGLGGLFSNQAALLVPDGNVVAILFQLNTLIIPPLAPVLLWVWQSRDSAMLRHLSVLKSGS